MSSIIVNDLSFNYPNQDTLFHRLCFSVEKQSKVAIVGDNGKGKSTLLKLLAKELLPIKGSIITSSLPYYVRQSTGLLNKTAAEILNVDKKLHALHAIVNGSSAQEDFDMLNDDWDIEIRCAAALDYWQLSHVSFEDNVDVLSGGEKNKLFLAGLMIHQPEIILLDEPSNHLDISSRKLLYRFIKESKSTMVVVSHDITLLDLIDTTYELSGNGMKKYGGNYDFYKKQKEIEVNALNETVAEQEKSLRMAKKKAREVTQRQEKRAAGADKKDIQGPRILINALHNSAEKTSSKLNAKHAGIIDSGQIKLKALRQQQHNSKSLQIDFDNAAIHEGKLLVDAIGINFGYDENDLLWNAPIDVKLYSGDRMQVFGDNGSGKTTLVKLLVEMLKPLSGTIKSTGFKWVYLDQNYSMTDADCTVVELAKQFNTHHFEDHELKMRLNRFLFSENMWDRNCRQLSGGEKMRLSLCCLSVSNEMPDLIILDEPTNNLDISSLNILTDVIRNYKGSVIVISHDTYFIEKIGVNKEIILSARKTKK